MADNASDRTCSTGNEHCSSGASSPNKQYQATVEDDPDSDIEAGSCYKNAPSLFGDDVEASRPAKPQNSSARRPSVLRTAKNRNGQAPPPSRIRHENLHVHFSERQPPQTYSVKASPPEDARPRQNSSRPRVSSNCHQGRFKSAVDTRWGLLFSEDGRPTDRLKQLLAGIAEHLKLEKRPRNSLVISPKKLQNFYERYPCQEELISFPDLFRCTSSQDFRALESIYSDMDCEYHLAPESRDRAPNMPALTSDGFVQWMVCCILANPEQEAYRLDKIVRELPIETRKLVEGGVSSVPERVPKQLSRYLLPAKPDEGTKSQLQKACEAKRLPTSRSSTSTQGVTTSPRRSSSKRGREEHRDDYSRRYMPQSRVDDSGREYSRSRSNYQHSTRHELDKAHRRRSGRDHRSLERSSSRYHRNASPRSSRRSVVYETSNSSAVDDRYYHERGHSDKSLNRTSSSRSSRRNQSPSRDSRPTRDRSPDHYSRHRRGSHHSSSGGSSPRDSHDGDHRSRYDRQGYRIDDYWGDSERSERRR